MDPQLETDGPMQSLISFWHELTARPDFWGFISIPIVAAIVTWVHVWWAMRMVFYPLDFIGIKTPQLERAIGLHPLGWQGIIPRKARKMSDIVVDRVIHKMGSVSDFLRQMEPEKVAAYVSASVSGNIEVYTDEVMRERNSLFWDNLPVTIKQRIYSHVRSHLPRIMDGVVRAMIEHIDDLVDVKEMCGRQMENDKALVVRMFLEVGDREVKFIINASFWIGLAFGLVQMVLFWFIPWHGLLPLYAAQFGATHTAVGIYYAAVYLAFAFLDRLPGPWQIGATFVLFAVYALYYAFTEGAEKAFVADTARPEVQGSAFGMYNFVVGLGALPASVLIEDQGAGFSCIGDNDRLGRALAPA